jgi:hypothetical protein
MPVEFFGMQGQLGNRDVDRALARSFLALQYAAEEKS